MSRISTKLRAAEPVLRVHFFYILFFSFFRGIFFFLCKRIRAIPACVRDYCSLTVYIIMTIECGVRTREETLYNRRTLEQKPNRVAKLIYSNPFRPWGRLLNCNLNVETRTKMPLRGNVGQHNVICYTRDMLKSCNALVVLARILQYTCSCLTIQSPRTCILKYILYYLIFMSDKTIWFERTPFLWTVVPSSTNRIV